MLVVLLTRFTPKGSYRATSRQLSVHPSIRKCYNARWICCGILVQHKTKSGNRFHYLFINLTVRSPLFTAALQTLLCITLLVTRILNHSSSVPTSDFNDKFRSTSTSPSALVRRSLPRKEKKVMRIPYIAIICLTYTTRGKCCLLYRSTSIMY